MEKINEFQDFGIYHIAEVTHQNAHKQNECDSERNPCHLKLAKPDTRGYNERIEHDSARKRFIAGTYQSS